MSVRMKLTHSKTGSRRAHHRVGTPSLVATATGHRRRHFADPKTGMYRGKQIITIGDNKPEAKPQKAEKKVVASKEKSEKAADTK